ncbi:MAG: ATP-binding protein [Bacteroidota bacterium]
MIPEDLLNYIICDQAAASRPVHLIKRLKTELSETKRIAIFTGVRRCGKSTFLKQLFQENSTSLFINFEDPRLEGFEVNDFYKIEKIAEKEGKTLFIFDEIQNVPEWERYVRAANEMGKKIYITGSNASMLSRELGTKLTGRYRQTELFPFDYNEYLSFRACSPGKDSFDRYLQEGGFPESLAENDSDYLRTLLKDIIIRDIAVRRKIRNESLLVRLAVFLLSNTGKEFSYNRITQLLHIRSVRTTIDYCDFLHESYLVDMVPRFSYSVRQQQGNPKKVYAIDTGLSKANSLSLSSDEGRLLENAVYLHLRRSGDSIEFYKDEKSECDFLVRGPFHKSLAIQVCHHLNEENLSREIAGLKNARSRMKGIKGAIITLDQEDTLAGFPVIPAWKWLSHISEI